MSRSQFTCMIQQQKKEIKHTFIFQAYQCTGFSFGFCWVMDDFILFTFKKKLYIEGMLMPI